MYHKFLIIVIVSFALTFGTGPAGADSRSDFLAAERAYKSGDSAGYRTLKGRLAGYPLLPYLEYRELADGLPGASPGDIERFLDTYADTPLASRLRSAWLDRLADADRWSAYTDAYKDGEGGIARQCRYLEALIHTGREKEAFARVEPLWLHGSSRPDACNPVFDRWRASGRLTRDLVWQRISLAMDNGSEQLAKYLERYLPGADRTWLQLWLRIDEHPQDVAQRSLFSADHPYRKAIVAHGIKRLGKTDPHQAAELWKDYRNRFGFSAQEGCPVDEDLAIRLEDEPDRAAFRFFEEVEPCSDADRLQEARIRAALLHGDWSAVVRWIDALPDERRSDEQWLYWKARALETEGKRKDAEKLYLEASKERTYYGFLAADRIDAPYRSDHIPIDVSDEVARQVARLPAIARMRELRALDREIDARREWVQLTPTLSTEELLAATQLYQQWDWIDRAIFTSARAKYWDDLEVRFPLRYRSTVQRFAAQRDLDPSWVFGVLRQESAFMEDVRSSAGAVGLMQVMPDTAGLVARTLGLSKPSSASLVDPETNIALGTGYLRMMLDDLGDNPVLATAAYNAGPHRVKRWMPAATLDADIWVELIPFKETRTYVQRVMSYTAIYDQRLGKEPRRLSQRMTAIRSPYSGTLSQARRR